MAINIESQDPTIPNGKTPGNGKVLVGMLLLILGIGFLLQQLNFFFIPNWLISWPMGMIVLGLYLGAKHNFQNLVWIILVLVGVANLSEDMFPGADLDRFFWPLGIISVGIWLILRRNQSWNRRDRYQKDWGAKWEAKFGQQTYGTNNPFEPVVTPVTPVTPTDPETGSAIPPSGSTTIPPAGNFGGNPLRGDDYLDAVSIFGGVKKMILSKNFRGGEIVNVFGGAELDFTQADINGRVVIDITQIFGGTKIIVPANWQVVSDLAAVFASVDDKRIKTMAIADSNKILVLKGVSIFAGVDIRSY